MGGGLSLHFCAAAAARQKKAKLTAAAEVYFGFRHTGMNSLYFGPLFHATGGRPGRARMREQSRYAVHIKGLSLFIPMVKRGNGTTLNKGHPLP